MNFDKLIKKRASIRKYSDKKVKIGKVIEALEAANLTSSPGNLTILKYIIIEDSEKKAEIAEACRQEFVKEAPFIVVVCSDPKKVEIMYAERAQKYIKHHTGAAIENFLLKITDLGLASCWVGAFSDITIKNLLNIPEDIDVEAVLPVAYQAKTDKTKQKAKSTLNNRVYFETWKNTLKKPFEKIRRENI